MTDNSNFTDEIGIPGQPWARTFPDLNKDLSSSSMAAMDEDEIVLVPDLERVPRSRPCLLVKFYKRTNKLSNCNFS